MARTRGRGRVVAGDLVVDSSASESESLVIPSSSNGDGSAIPSASEGESEGGEAGGMRRSPRKRSGAGGDGVAAAMAAMDVISNNQMQTSSAPAKRPFKPARSARKTTQPPSSAAKKRALAAAAAAAAAFEDTTSESENDYQNGNRGAAAATEDESEDEMQLATSRVIHQRDSEANNVAKDEEEEDEEGDETIWVPVDRRSQVNGSASKRKRDSLAPSSSSRPGESDRGTPRPSATPTLRQLAKQARIILENAMDDPAAPLRIEDKDVLSDFLGSMTTPDVEDDSEQEARTERILLDTFELSVKSAGKDFSIVELIDITTCLILFSDSDDPNALKLGLPLALENFAMSTCPAGLRLTRSILELQFALKIQLILARARMAGEILEEENEAILDDDQDLALKFVEDGQEALWDGFQKKAAEIIAIMMAENADIDDLLAEYPYEAFLAAFLRHVKRVLTHLRRSTTIRQGSIIASSPSKYFEHIARKRLKTEEARRRSAPPPRNFGIPNSPYEGLKETLRNARKSSPIRRPPPPPTSARAFQAIGTSRVQENSQDQTFETNDDSDEEVENVLLTRSSMPPTNEQDEGEGVSEGTSMQESANGEEGMIVEEEREIVETQIVETQAVQRNLLDRSAIGAFLGPQAEETQGESQSQVDFWGDGLQSTGGNDAPLNIDNDDYPDIATYGQEELVLEESQASQAVPGRSDAPSPSLANPQSFDDSLYDELNQDTEEEADETVGHVNGQSVEDAVAPAETDTSLVAEELGDEQVQAEQVAAEVDDTLSVEEAGDGSTVDAPPPAEDPSAQSQPPPMAAKKGPNWFEKQADAERITMSSQAQSVRGTTTAQRTNNNTRAARKSTAARPASVDPTEQVAEQQATDGDDQIPPSARKAAPPPFALPSGSGPRTRRKVFQYMEVEGTPQEDSENTESAIEVAATRQSAKQKATSTNGRRRGRPPGKSKAAADPEQATTRMTLPTRRGRRKSGPEAVANPTASGEEAGSDPADHDPLNLPTPQRRLAAEMQDEYVDELASGPEEESAPVASTSKAPARRRAPRRAAARVSGVEEAVTPVRPAKASAKGKARAISPVQSSPAAPATDVPDDDTLNNDPEQLVEKRQLFADAIKAHQEGLEQTDKFKLIKDRYNAIALMYPKYVDERASAVTTWTGSERKTFLVALDLMPNPLATRRYKSILQDHGINGIVTRNLKNRKSSQLKDKGENIKALHKNAPITNPAFAFFQDTLKIGDMVVRKPHRKRKPSQGKKGVTDNELEEDIEDPDAA